MKKSILSLLIFTMASMQTVWAQKVLIYKSDDTTVEYETADIDSMVFVQDEPVTIPSYLTCPDDNHPHAIDLGLPSGTQWCCCNVGATYPRQSGGYFAWGEITEKDKYTEANYSYFVGLLDTGGDGYIDENFSVIDIGLDDIAGTQYDVASVRMGKPWHMPSMAQLSELLYNHICSIIAVDNSYFRVTGPNGGYIILPKAGFKVGASNRSDGGAYWSSEISRINSSSAEAYKYGGFFLSWKHGNRFCGIPVRAVCP